MKQKRGERMGLVVAFGKAMTVDEWSVATGMKPMTIYQRLHRGWDPEMAVSVSPRPKREKKHAEEVGKVRGGPGAGADNGGLRRRVHLKVLQAEKEHDDRGERGAVGDVPANKRSTQLTLSAAWKVIGSLGKTSKMPGYSYGLDAFKCITGSELAEVPGSTCVNCYARRNFYKTWRPAKIARERRHASLDHPRWIEAMALLINHRCAKEPWFRWHDSGDIMSLEHLENIVEVCRRTSGIKHWLPTREYGFVWAYLKRHGSFPDNLCVRVSAKMVGKKPRLPLALQELPTSTVHQAWQGPVQVDDRRSHSVACKAPERDNQCMKCRACWSNKVINVSYKVH